MFVQSHNNHGKLKLNCDFGTLRTATKSCLIEFHNAIEQWLTLDLIYVSIHSFIHSTSSRDWDYLDVANFFNIIWLLQLMVVV